MIHHGDCLDVLKTMQADSVDSCVTDPPYALEFMGKSWDSFDEHEDAGFAYWLSGLIDGEGCFTVKAHTRGTHAPQFTLKMRADEEGTLQAIVRHMGIGTLSREDGDPNPTVRWTVGDKAGCQRLVDLLDKYPLRAKKRLDYDIWREAVCVWAERPRGNRWHGAADDSRMRALRGRLMNGRVYSELAWSGNHFQDWCRIWGAEVLRVLKPGGHILAFGGARTYHRLASGLEDAGFEVRDSLAYLYGSGFPKSLNLGEGLGTALKPAHEPIVLARKPFKGTVKGNVERFGTGALNIDACRIGEDDTRRVKEGGRNQFPHEDDAWDPKTVTVGSEFGRWPANVVIDEIAAAVIDEQSGELTSGFMEEGTPRHPDTTTRNAYGVFNGSAALRPTYADTGGASRFYYCAKPSREERDMGCYGLSARTAGECTDRQDGSAGLNNPRAGAGRTGGGRNFHPTVKPVELMRWLVKLVTPIGGTVLDPFLGSGTTGMAAQYEQRPFIGIEREAEYIQIAERRIAAVAPLFQEHVS